MWGFDLDMTAVRLLRRDTGDWQEVAAEKIEGADIEERLMALVDRIDEGASVVLFLPRDQILYTDVALHSGEDAQTQVQRALVETTPYPLEEIDYDWELSGPDKARIAAIALETLDEAVAFAEVRGVKVGGFSSFADAADFPRRPEFKSHSILRIDEDVEDPTPVVFSSARTPSKPRPDAGSLAPVAPDTQPIIKVDDDAPVMRIKAPASLPLDPGTPIATPTQTPRIRTDIASAVVSEQVASLSPPSVKVRKSGPTVWKIGAVFALALLITVGVATLVWRLLPLGPSDLEIPVSEDTGAGVEAPADAVETVDILTPEPEPEQAEPATPPETETVEATPLPDLPQPVVFDIADVTTAPLAEGAASLSLADLTPVVPLRVAQPLAQRARADSLPFVDLGTPAEPTPDALAGVLVAAPGLAPLSLQPIDPPDGVYVASVDANDLALDAIALPASGAFVPQGLPAMDEPPAPLPAQTAETEPVDGAQTADAPDVASTTEPEPTVDVAPRPETALVARLDANELADLPRVSPVAPPEAPAQSEASDSADAAAGPSDSVEGLPTPTDFAAGLTDRAPRARPQDFVARIERNKFGGRTRSELARLRPPARPASEQMAALAARSGASEASALAVGASPLPRGRPRDFDAIVAVALVQRQAEQVTASLDYQTPNTNAAIEAALLDDSEPEPRPQNTAPARAPSIPSSASVARQATIENAIRLNRVNLVGVYGTSADRRALVRLPSGRFVKVKVGDRVDGGTVERITDDELIYLKGRKTVLLSVPKG